MIVRICGRIDSGTAAAFEAHVLGLVASGVRRLVVDCEALDYISSAGLRVLLVAAKRLASGGGKIALSGVGGQIAQVFDIVGFASIFTTYATSGDAVAALRAG